MSQTLSETLDSVENTNSRLFSHAKSVATHTSNVLLDEFLASLARRTRIMLQETFIPRRLGLGACAASVSNHFIVALIERNLRLTV